MIARRRADMQALLGKETRERKLWGIAICLAMVVAAHSHGYTFYGSLGPAMLTWSLGPALIACLFGATSYSSEMMADRAAFLLTRPVSWKKVALAKMTAGMGFLAAASIASAMAYRLSCPDPYLPFADGHHLLLGVAYSLMISGTAFMIGFACSTVLPGIAGGPLVLVVVATLCSTLFGVMGVRLGGWPWIPMQFAWPLACLAGAITVARFGLTLSSTSRLRRYSASVLCGMIALALLMYVAPHKRVAGLSDRIPSEIITWSISPDGQYALGRDRKSVYWLENASNVVSRLEGSYEDYQASHGKLFWRAPHTAYRLRSAGEDWSVRMYSPRGSGAVAHDIRLGKLLAAEGLANPFALMASPDGRIAAIKLSGGMDLPQTVIFLDTVTQELLPDRLILPAEASRWWWQSSRELGYLDDKEEANLFRLRD